MAKLTLDQFAKLVKKYPNELEAAIIRGLRDAALQGQGILVQEIDNAKAVDNGALRQSAYHQRLAKGAAIGANAPHAPFLEYGTRPHTPPLEPLILWVIRKGLAENDEEAEQIARAIQKSIGKNGTKPRHYFAKTMKRVNRLIGPSIKRELKAMKLL